MSKEEIFLLTDYRGQFYSSTKFRGAAVDLEKLEKYFKNLGFKLIITPFSKINFRTQDYKDKWVIYQSSEDPGLFYRSYIEDIILGLYMQGARLIHDLFLFRAHHNKHFMEIIRDVQDLPEIKNIEARRFGTYEDYLKESENLKGSDFVIKSSDTSKSSGVFMLSNLKDKIKIPRILSRTLSLKNIKYLIEWIMKGQKPLPISNNRRKFILQPYIPGLNGDYRIIIYGKKYYVLYRENRPNDFRASGSMRFNSEADLPKGILDYAKKVFESFNTPYMALDIGVKDGTFYLFEFQFLSFGQYTLEKSKFYYYLDIDNKWNREYEIPDLEREISSSVVLYINKH